MGKVKMRINWETFIYVLLIVFVMVIILIALCYFLYTLDVLNYSEISKNTRLSGTLQELKELQHKVIDGSVIVFLVTIGVTLLITLGIYQMNKNSNILHRYKEQLNVSRKELESNSLIYHLYPPVISIHVLSVTQIGENINSQYPPSEILNSCCHKINRQLDVIKLIIVKLSSIDKISKEVLDYYLGEAINNIDQYKEGNNIVSNPGDFVYGTISTIEEYRKQINDLEEVNFLNKSLQKNFKIPQ